MVWATCEANEDEVIKLWGWNWASDVKEKGVFRDDNIWLKDDADMRSMESLVQVLSENINSESQQIYDMSLFAAVFVGGMAAWFINYVDDKHQKRN